MAQEAEAARAMAEAARQTYAAALKNGSDQSTVPELVTILTMQDRGH
jgi:hypothetical protein